MIERRNKFKIIQVCNDPTDKPYTNYSSLLINGLKSTNACYDIQWYAPKKKLKSTNKDSKNIWTSKMYPFQIFKKACRDRPEIIHIQYEFTTFGAFYTNIMLPLLLLLLRFINLKIVITIHSVIPRSYVDKDFIDDLLYNFTNIPLITSLFKIFLVYLYKSIILFSDVIIVHGDWYKNNLFYSYGVNLKKVSVIPYGVLKYEKEDNYYNMEVEKNNSVVLFFGHITPRKDIITLLKAFKKFVHVQDESKLIIAGGLSSRYYNYYKVVKKTIISLGLSNYVRFLGYVKDEDIPTIFKSSDFIVFPYKYSVAGPSGPLSCAIAYNVPFIAFDVGFIGNEVRRYNLGLLEKKGDCFLLFKSMMKMSNKNVRNRYIHNYNKIKLERTWEKVASETCRIYCKLLM